MFYAKTILVSFALLLSFNAHASAWKSFRCESLGLNNWILIEKSELGKVYVSTPETQRFLIGLTCDIPSESEPLMFCRDSVNLDISFSSNWLIESGFPKDTYGQYVSRERLSINLSYSYRDNENNYKTVEREWFFDKSGCTLNFEDQK